MARINQKVIDATLDASDRFLISDSETGATKNVTTEQVAEYVSSQSYSEGGGWDESHIILGSTHIWVDTAGDLRIKGSAPTSDTDGVVV